MEQKKIQLAQKALSAREMAYAPYSQFAVGAAILTVDGKIYTGCNIENAAYSATNCAERTAIFKAVSEGISDFKMIAVAGGKQGETPQEYCPPCGVCRQVLAEFCPEDMPVLLVKDKGEFQEWTLKELLPAAFQKNNL